MKFDNPFAPIKPDRLAIIENPFAPPKPDDDGKLTPERWRSINELISWKNGLHDELIAVFSYAYGLSRRRLKAEIKTFRLASPPTLQ